MIRIRPYKESDEARILSWCNDEDTFYKWTAGVWGDYPITAEQLRKTGDMIRFTAIDEKDPVGFFIIRNPRDTLDELRIGFVIVDPARRGQGVGKAMLGLGLDFAFNIYRAKSVELGVFEDNVQAHSCYAAIGFVDTDARETYIVHGEERTSIVMECRRA